MCRPPASESGTRSRHLPYADCREPTGRALDGRRLDEFVTAHGRALVAFHTEGCGKCAAMEPVLDGVAKATD